MKKAFSLLEALLAITLIGVMGVVSFSFLNVSTLSKEGVKTKFQSHLNIITAAVLQCKELSGSMPTNSGALASATPLNTLTCSTTTPYLLDGGNGSFIPPALRDFTIYTATQIADVFFITTTTPKSSTNYEVLQELQNSYSLNQYELTDDGTTATLNFYISR